MLYGLGLFSGHKTLRVTVYSYHTMEKFYVDVEIGILLAFAHRPPSSTYVGASLGRTTSLSGCRWPFEMWIWQVTRLSDQKLKLRLNLSSKLQSGKKLIVFKSF